MATLRAALADRARVRRTLAVGPRIEGRSPVAAIGLEWFACRLTVSDAPEVVGAEGGRRVVAVRAELVAAPGTDIAAMDELLVESATLGTAVWAVVGAPVVVRSRSRARAVVVPLRRTVEPTMDRLTA